MDTPNLLDARAGVAELADAQGYQIARNCRTSVEMIEKSYAAHIKTNLDPAAINIRRPKPKKNGKKKATPPPEED